ncbi:MAG TPA: hypothetical protein ENJ29_12270 [Bacteroidetes bacterium]|nr:hypothetical protein [Bacteroidota bacterium]
MKVNSVSQNAITAYRREQQPAKNRVEGGAFSEKLRENDAVNPQTAPAKRQAGLARPETKPESGALMNTLSAEEKIFIEKVFSEQVAGGYTRAQKKDMPPQKGLNIDLFA